ncbi:MAG: hypothetical protein OXT74_04045 [Candidatus Poribacteria bacterium]|nr:hypothetical protein [Candidatus Poribacteria bacterium]
MTNKLSLTFILVPLLFVIWLAGCGESETIVPAPTGQVLKGTFVLTKAVKHELMDVGGPDLDDPIIIRRVPTTYIYPAGTGTLTLGEDTFELDAPLPVHPLKYRGRFKAVEEVYRRFGDDLPSCYYKKVNDDEFTSKLVIDVYYESGHLEREYGKYPYEWIGDTLKLDFWRRWDPVYIYELYWTRA